jgi:zinc protease
VPKLEYVPYEYVHYYDQEKTMHSIAKKVIPIALCLFAIRTAAAQTATGADVLRETLKNGLQVVIVPNSLAPVVTTEVNYLVGSNETPLGFPGMAHAQEHMMFRGSPGLSAGQLANLIAAMGGQFDADTQQTVTQYFFTVPADDLEMALHIEAIRMKDVLDSEDLWHKERGAIEQEVAQDFSNPMYVFYERLISGMLAGTPYAHTPLGTRPSFQKTTGGMLKKFYDTWYAPNNAVMIIAGDVDAQKTLATVKKLFDQIPSKTLPRKPPIELSPLQPATIAMDTDLPYGLAVVAYRLPGYGEPDYAAGQILADVLGSQRGNLYALVPEGKALLFDFSTSIFPHAGLGYGMAGFPQGVDGSSLVAAMKSIIADYVNKGFPADLIEAAKRQEVRDAEFQKNSISGLASQWSQALAVQGLHSPAENIEALKKVSVEEVNRVAKKYLVNETATVGILTPAPSGKPVEVKEFHGRENFAPKQAEAVPLPEWAKKAARPPSLPKSRINPTDMKLSNGLRLIIQQTTISPTVGVYGEVKHNSDLETPKGKEGVADVLDSLFSYGTTTLDRLAFQKALDDIGAEASAGPRFSLQVLDADFDRGVELLADNLLHPALPESAFKVVKQETINMVEGQLKSPYYLFSRALHADLYPENDPTLRHPTPESLGSLTLADVRHYYTKVFRPDLTTIVVIGNTTPQTAKAIIEKYFGIWKAAGEKPPTELPAVPRNKPATTAVPDAARVQDLVVLAQTLGLTRSNPDYYTLQVGNHVLSGAFYASRLYRDLREKTGLVYMVESALNVKKTRGNFEVVYACDPPNVSRARAIVEQDLIGMQTSLVTPDELMQAKSIVVRGIPLSESSTDGIASKLLHYSLEDLPLDESVRAAKHYLETSSPQIKEAFSKWIRPSGFVQATLGPPPQ